MAYLSCNDYLADYKFLSFNDTKFHLLDIPCYDIRNSPTHINDSFSTIN